MEDLIWLLLVATVAVIVVCLALTLLVLLASIAAVCVFGAAVYAFAATFARGILHRGGQAAASGPSEPAFRAYYRGQVWRDLNLAVGAAWSAAKGETDRIRRLVGRQSGGPQGSATLTTVIGWAFTVYAYIGLVLGAILTAVIGVVPALIILLVAGVAWAVGAPLRGIERLRRRRTGAYFDCSTCHDRFPLPVYLCPTCDARHKELSPGPFGVLSHRCTCGSVLPAVQWRGRERLASECPKGHVLDEAVGVLRTIHVPVAGGPSTGKSTFLAAALLEFDQASQDGRLATTVQTTSRQAYERMLDAFRQGIPAPKTDGVPPAVTAEVRGKDRAGLLYAYDVAGEVYGDEDELRRDPAHGLAEGVVLLVDPFSLARVRADLGEQIDAEAGLNPSEESPQRMLERLIGVFAEQGTDLSHVSAAICVTKTDALGIGDAIAAAPGDDDDARTRAWLDQQGEGNFVRAAEDAFRTVRCFGVSALGRTPGTGSGPFRPVGASAPLLWLLGRAGIEPATDGRAQVTTTEQLRNVRPLDVTPRRPLYTKPIDDVGQLSIPAHFGIGAVAMAAILVAFSPLSTISTTTTDAADGNLVSEQSDDLDDGSTGAGDTTEASFGDGDDTSTDTDTDTGTTDTTDGSGEESGGAGYNPNTPTRILRRHYAHLDDGEYAAAFRLMSASYRSRNPKWTSERSQAGPNITIDSVGPASFPGGGVARVHVSFYAQDTYETSSSDTICRHFEGTVTMRKQDGAWRYDPPGDFSVTELSDDACS